VIVLTISCDNIFSQTLVDSLGAVNGVECINTVSSEQAYAELTDKVVDAVILDFDGIRASQDTDLDVAEPLNLISRLASDFKYLSVYCLTTADLSVEQVTCLLDYSHHVDTWVSGNAVANTKLCKKCDVESLVSTVASVSEVVRSIDQIDVNGAGKLLILDPAQRRALKLFTARSGGVSCVAETVNEGLSGAKVLKVKVEDETGGERIRAIAKLGSHSDIQIELDNYRKEVSRLPNGAYAPKVGRVYAGASNVNGIFYRLLTDDVPFYQVIVAEPERAAGIINSLKQVLDHMHQNPERVVMSIGDIRRTQFSDRKLSKVLLDYPDLEWIYDIEKIEVPVMVSWIHGDLHGGNVFVGQHENPALIDFADVKKAPVAIDPITLELSLFTHGPTREEGQYWSPEVKNIAWFLTEDYARGSHFEPFILACRQWGHEIAGGDKAVCACCYSYLIRQLKYPDVDHDLIRGLLESVAETIHGL
jgi:Phosphotransferase enzyme family